MIETLSKLVFFKGNLWVTDFKSDKEREENQLETLQALWTTNMTASE